MELKLETPDGAEVQVEHQELPQDVAAGKAAFERAQASNPAEDEKRTPPKRQPREIVHDDDKPRRGRPSKADSARTTTKTPAQSQKPAVKAQTDDQRREGVKGIVQIASTVALILDQRTPAEDISFKADAYTLAANSDALANAVVETAKHNEGFARAVDKITAAGPYAALTAVVLSIGAQLAANHGVQAARAMGAADPRDVVAAFEAA